MRVVASRRTSPGLSPYVCGGGEVDLDVDGGLGDDRVDARRDDARDRAERRLDGLGLPAQLGQVVARRRGRRGRRRGRPGRAGRRCSRRRGWRALGRRAAGCVIAGSALARSAPSREPHPDLGGVDVDELVGRDGPADVRARPRRHRGVHRRSAATRPVIAVHLGQGRRRRRLEPDEQVAVLQRGQDAPVPELGQRGGGAGEREGGGGDARGHPPAAADDAPLGRDDPRDEPGQRAARAPRCRTSAAAGARSRASTGVRVRPTRVATTRPVPSARSSGADEGPRERPEREQGQRGEGDDDRGDRRRRAGPQQEGADHRPPGVAGRLATSPAMTASSTATTAATASPSRVIVVSWVPAQESRPRLRRRRSAERDGGDDHGGAPCAEQRQEDEHQHQAGRQGQARASAVPSSR